MTRILIPTALQQFTGNVEEIDLQGSATVGDLLTQLTNEHPALTSQLYNKTNTLKPFVNLYVGDTDVRALRGMQTPVGTMTELSIVPGIAGGVDAPAINPAALISPERANETPLTNDEILRYSRHLILPEVTLEGQKKLRAAKILLIGSGGLGSPLALYLAAAGVGTIGLVDFDVVDYTNLQRQILHGTDDVGRPKVVSARESIRDINPFVKVVTYDTEFTSQNAMEIAKDYDILIDGTDNFPTRYLTNDVSVLLGKPNVYGSIFRFEGQASVFWAEHGPCYRCLYPEPPPPGLVPSCAEGGVLGVLPGIVGCMQAIEGIKLILGIGTPLIGRLVLFNALKMQFRELKLRKDPNCPICGNNPTIHELIDYEQFCGIRGEETEAVPVAPSEEITVVELKKRLDNGEQLTIVDVREPFEYAIAHIPGTLLIPLGQVAERARELNPDEEIILHCKVGKRSAEALGILKAKGFKNLKNVVGGILAWSEEVDPNVPRY